MNLGFHVGDDPQAVLANHALLESYLPTKPHWLRQVHGTSVVRWDGADRAVDARHQAGDLEADACLTHVAGTVCAIQMADCLPVLLCNREGTVVGVAHAGWRGLVNGVIEATVDAFHQPAAELMAYLGPCIGAQQFEVGEDVRVAMLEADSGATVALRSHRPGKWMADLAMLARRRLERVGLTEISTSGFCTVEQAQTYYSFRRDGQTGRMAALIWFE